jgi:phosphoribosylformylglycinamidine synthase
MVWHRDTEIPSVDLIVIPGGFSYGDYLRPGAIAARSPIMTTVRQRALDGVATLGICNGFQVLTETGLLPGVLLRNAGLHFICKPVPMKVINSTSVFTNAYNDDQVIRMPVAHNEGNFCIDPEMGERLFQENRVAFAYCAEDGAVEDGSNPNGSFRNIAGILNGAGNVLGMMPHPERCAEKPLGGEDGTPLFKSLLKVLDG